MALGKYLAYVLRHNPADAGLTMDKYGWVEVVQLLTALDVTMEELEETVATDSKQRYSFNPDKTLIRANQGHSIPVDLQLVPKEPPVVLWHGTASRFLADILAEGLRPMSRQYVHLSSDMDTAITVGKRHGKLVVLAIDTQQMIKDGYKFYQSENGVWLTNEVPPQYLKEEV